MTAVGRYALPLSCGAAFADSLALRDPVSAGAPFVGAGVSVFVCERLSAPSVSAGAFCSNCVPYRNIGGSCGFPCCAPAPVFPAILRNAAALLQRSAILRGAPWLPVLILCSLLALLLAPALLLLLRLGLCSSALAPGFLAGLCCVWACPWRWLLRVLLLPTPAGSAAGLAESRPLFVWRAGVACWRWRVGAGDLLRLAACRAGAGVVQ